MKRPPIEAALTAVVPGLSGARLRSDPVYRSRMVESRSRSRLQAAVRQAHTLQKALQQAEGWAFTMGNNVEARRPAHWEAKAAPFFSASRGAFNAQRAIEAAILEADTRAIRDATRSGETMLAELRGLGF